MTEKASTQKNVPFLLRLFPAVLHAFSCAYCSYLHISLSISGACVVPPQSYDGILEVMMGPKGRKSNVKSCIFIIIAFSWKRELTIAPFSNFKPRGGWVRVLVIEQKTLGPHISEGGNGDLQNPKLYCFWGADIERDAAIQNSKICKEIYRRPDEGECPANHKSLSTFSSF